MIISKKMPPVVERHLFYLADEKGFSCLICGIEAGGVA